MIEINKDSLIVKMIEKSLWWMGEDMRFEAPTTTCGLFFGGVLSGLVHVFYTIVMLCMGWGALSTIAFLIDVDLLTAINFEILPTLLKVLILLGGLITVAGVMVILPSYLCAKVIHFIRNKYEGSAKFDYILSKAVEQVKEVLRGVGKIASKFCKPVKYK